MGEVKLHSEGETFLLDGEGGDGWRLDLLPRWVQYRIAPFTAAHRAKMLSELLTALQAASPLPNQETLGNE